MDDGKKWFELVNKMESSKGYEILQKERHLLISNYVFHKNAKDLANLIKKYEKDLSIWDINNRMKLEEMQHEFLRLLHNYLSSAFSLVEHTYVFKDKLKNIEFTKFYEENSENFKIDEVLNFIKDLRRYAQHYKLPFSSAVLSFKASDKKDEKGTSKQELLLPLNELLQWERWSSPSKSFLKKQSKNINLKDVIAEHYGKISKFYKKIYEKINVLYKREIEECTNIEKEIFKLQETINNKK